MVCLIDTGTPSDARIGCAPALGDFGAFCSGLIPPPLGPTRRLQGLDYLRANEVAHGDLKPDYLLLSSTGTVKVADFGSSQLTRACSLVNKSGGTPAFYAPEMCCGSPSSAAAADIWALGVGLYMFVYGECPLHPLPAQPPLLPSHQEWAQTTTHELRPPLTPGGALDLLFRTVPLMFCPLSEVQAMEGACRYLSNVFGSRNG